MMAMLVVNWLVHDPSEIVTTIWETHLDWIAADRDPFGS